MSEKKFDVNRGCFFVRSEDQSVSVEKKDGSDKLNTYNWLEDIEALTSDRSDIYEVRFKNTRKGYYVNASNMPLKKGDVVAVEAAPGHDIGIVSLTGDMVRMQMKKSGFKASGVEFKKIYRIAKPSDIEKWQESIALEYPTMIKARQIASSLSLNMKIGDVEFQGDKVKAIFYYIADERVDFRELIKIFADQFRVRIEMKQIGARQEAGRIGGIGACGRELCCSSWVSNFVSVTTNAARLQEISLNPQKLAGQCGKLKCCLNYEVDSYIDARKDFPRITAPLETVDGSYFLVKADIFKREMSFSSDPSSMVNIITIPVDRVREVVRINRKGGKVDRLQSDRQMEVSVEQPDYKNVVGEESITRFDAAKKRRNNNNNRGRDRNRPKEGEQSSSVVPALASEKQRDDRRPRNRTSGNGARNNTGDGVSRNRPAPSKSVQGAGDVSSPSPAAGRTDGGASRNRRRNAPRRNKSRGDDKKE